MTHQELSVRPKQEVSEEQTRAGLAFLPDVDIYETKDSLWLTADMPGVDEKSVQVNLNDGVLTIEATVTLDDYQDISPVYSEYRVGNYRRRFNVSNQVDGDRIKGRMVNGVLHLELPKAEAAKPRRINISAT
jgi:HSP20 family molecular chaperone IbpA